MKYGPKAGEFFALKDATIACAYAELATAALGLGTVWVGAIDVPEVRRIGVLGATGYTGRLVADELAARGLPHRSGARNPERLGAMKHGRWLGHSIGGHGNHVHVAF